MLIKEKFVTSMVYDKEKKSYEMVDIASMPNQIVISAIWYTEDTKEEAKELFEYCENLLYKSKATEEQVEKIIRAFNDIIWS